MNKGRKKLGKKQKADDYVMAGSSQESNCDGDGFEDNQRITNRQTRGQASKKGKEKADKAEKIAEARFNESAEVFHMSLRAEDDTFSEVE